MAKHSGAKAHYSALAAAIDDAALFSVENQLHLAGLLGPTPHWRIVDGRAEFISRNGLIFPASIHPMGLLSRGMWTWAWADSHISEGKTTAIRQVHAFGEAHNLAVFTRPSFDLDDWRTTVTPVALITATQIIHRIWNWFAFPMPDGSLLYACLTVGHRPPLPTPTTSSIVQTVHHTQNALQVKKPLRALRSYANLRQLTRQENTHGKTVRLTASDGIVAVNWDKAGFTPQVVKKF